MSVTIRLQYLPLTAQASDIRNFFSGLRIPDGAVHIVGGEDGDAFIGFASDEDARQAMNRTGGKIHGTEVRLLLSSRSEMNEIIQRIKEGRHAPSAPKRPTNDSTGSPWISNNSNSSASAISPAQNQQQPKPSRYLPDPDVNQPAYARIIPKQEPLEPIYNKVPPLAGGAGGYQGHMSGKEQPTYPPFNPPLGRQPNMRQMNYGDTDNHYEASPAYKSPMYQQSPVIRDAEAKPYGYNAVEDRKPNVIQPASREAEDAISKLPPHLRPPHGIPPPHLRHLFPNIPTGIAELPPRDPAPRRDDPGHFNGPPPHSHFDDDEPKYMHHQDRRDERFPRDGPPGCQPRFGGGPPPREGPSGPRDFRGGNSDSWRGGQQPWENSRPSSFERPPSGRRPHDDFPNRRDGPIPRYGGPSPGQRGGFLNGGPPPNRSTPRHLQISRLPNDLLRPAAVEEFLRPSIPFSVSSVKVVFNPQGIHMHTLIRIENDADFERIMRRDGDQGIRVRTCSKTMFDEAIDGIPPACLPQPQGTFPSRRSSDDRRSSSRGGRSPVSRPPSRGEVTRRRTRSRSPSRGISRRRDRSRSRSPRRRRPRSRSPILGRRGGKQAPNRWCLMLTNVPFKIEADEILIWLKERVTPMKLTRTFYEDGNASDRWVAEFESESSMKRGENHRIPLNGRSIKMTYIDNDYADEIMAIEDRYGENRKKEYDMKQLAELQLQHLNGTLGPLGVPRFFNNGHSDPAANCPQVPQQHYPGGPFGQRPPMDPHGGGPPPMRGGRGGFAGRGGRGRGFGNVPHNGSGDYIPRWNSDPERRRSAGLDNYSNDEALFTSVGPSGSVIVCKGFPDNLTLADLQGFFSDYTFDEDTVRIHLDNNGKSTGDAVICLHNSEQAAEAVKALNGTEWHGSIINLTIPAY